MKKILALSVWYIIFKPIDILTDKIVEFIDYCERVSKE